jgi:regulator of nonsense transcripts 1
LLSCRNSAAEDDFILVCRNLQCAKSAESGISPAIKKDSWVSVIDEKQILTMIAGEPSDDDIKRSRDITIEMINKLENLRKTNPQATIQQIEHNQMSEPLPRTKNKYENGEEYYSIFSRLIDRESLIDKSEKEKQMQKDVEVSWELSMKHKWLAKFSFPSSEEYGTNWFIGNEMKLSCGLPNGGTFTSRGHAVRFTADDKIVLEIVAKDPPTTTTKGYTIEFVWKSTTYSRMKDGLKKFYRNSDSISKYLYEKILGHDPKIPERHHQGSTETINCEKLPALNFYQKQAVKEALRYPMTLIQGPPGTGKTITSSSIVFHLAQINRTSKMKNVKIMVCAPSNIVVDHLAETINKTGVRVVRLCSKSREIISSEAEPLTLHYQVRSLESKSLNRLKQLQSLLDEHGELSKEDENQYKKLYNHAEKQILENAEVICCTCSSSFDQRLNSYTFSQVLVDEATQAVEPECLLPLLKGAKKVILVGDHMQLGPVVVCREVANAGLKVSLFERLVKNGVKPVMLQIQYRMHPELSVFSSDNFYEGGLQNGISAKDREMRSAFTWPNPLKPVLFWHVRGNEEMSASGTSFLNRTEAEKINNILNEMIEGGISMSHIAIITPYKGQRGYLSQYLLKTGNLKQPLYKELEIASIDSFQGREKDYIIISTVRSSEGQGIGFLKDERR